MTIENSDKITRVDIVDTDDNDTMDTFYLVDPDKKKLDELQRLINNRYEDNDEDYIKDYGSIFKYINENFKSINIDRIEINW